MPGHGINESGNGFVTQLRPPATVLFYLDFADDLALLESDLERAQFQLNKGAKLARQLGL